MKKHEREVRFIYYCIGEKGKAIEIKGRGLSLGDAFDLLGFSFSGAFPVPQEVEALLNDGVLRYKKINGEAMPVIQYDNDTEEALCCIFQSKIRDGRYIELDVGALAKGLTYVFSRRKE